jgi:hypothetical protein
MGQALGRLTASLSKIVAARTKLHAAPPTSSEVLAAPPPGAGVSATGSSRGTGSLLDTMLARVAQGEGKEGGKDRFTLKTMVDNLITAFIAGTDTTGIVLAWMLHALAQDEELQAECAAEALGVDMDAADVAEIMARLPTIRSLYWEVARVNGPVGPQKETRQHQATQGHCLTPRCASVHPPCIQSFPPIRSLFWEVARVNRPVSQHKAKQNRISMRPHPPRRHCASVLLPCISFQPFPLLAFLPLSLVLILFLCRCFSLPFPYSSHPLLLFPPFTLVSLPPFTPRLPTSNFSTPLSSSSIPSHPFRTPDPLRLLPQTSLQPLLTQASLPQANFLFLEPAEGATVTLKGRTLLPPSQGGRINIVCLLRYASCTEAAGRRAGITNPGRFEPRRWILPDGSVRTPPMDGFLAFGHGLRVCPGKELSHTEATVCVAHVLRAFSLALPNEHPPVNSHSKFTQRPDTEISLRLTPRPDQQGGRTSP